MALVLSVGFNEDIKVGEDITIRINRKRRKGAGQTGFYRDQFTVSIQAPREINISRESCKNKEDNNVRMSEKEEEEAYDDDTSL